jgi:hypothetical protein
MERCLQLKTRLGPSLGYSLSFIHLLTVGSGKSVTIMAKKIFLATKSAQTKKKMTKIECGFLSCFADMCRLQRFECSYQFSFGWLVLERNGFGC